ncbi:hypothetical protein ACFYXH_32555 [Streptomyces sp. NPDC002730]|uniref:hypothetical protein n=1 Tax=Streptomyces sp. NPDC002730 TaxID=3364662 RepID=UPI0036CF6234
MTQSASDPKPRLTTLEIVLQWAQLPPEHLNVAMKALEPELARQHQRELEQARLEAADAKDARAHRLYLGGLIAGFLLSTGMLTGAVVVGVNGQAWLAAMLSGPSVLSLAALFVLRKVDAGAARQSALLHQSALGAGTQPGVDPALQSTPPGSVV